MDNLWLIMVDDDQYPLVICYIAIDHGHRNSGFFPLKHGDFPVRYVSHYRRVDLAAKAFRYLEF